MGRGCERRLREEEAATQFSVGLSRVEAIWSLSNQVGEGCGCEAELSEGEEQ